MLSTRGAIFLPLLLAGLVQLQCGSRAAELGKEGLPDSAVSPSYNHGNGHNDHNAMTGAWDDDGDETSYDSAIDEDDALYQDASDEQFYDLEGDEDELFYDAESDETLFDEEAAENVCATSSSNDCQNCCGLQGYDLPYWNRTIGQCLCYESYGEHNICREANNSEGACSSCCREKHFQRSVLYSKLEDNCYCSSPDHQFFLSSFKFTLNNA